MCACLRPSTPWAMPAIKPSASGVSAFRAPPAKAFLQSFGRAKYTTIDTNVLTKNDYIFVRFQLISERLIDRLH